MKDKEPVSASAHIYARNINSHQWPGIVPDRDHGVHSHDTEMAPTSRIKFLYPSDQTIDGDYSNPRN